MRSVCCNPRTSLYHLVSFSYHGGEATFMKKSQSHVLYNQDISISSISKVRAAKRQFTSVNNQLWWPKLVNQEWVVTPKLAGRHSFTNVLDGSQWQKNYQWLVMTDMLTAISLTHAPTPPNLSIDWTVVPRKPWQFLKLCHTHTHTLNPT